MTTLSRLETVLQKTQMVVFGLAVLGVPALAWSLCVRTPDDVHGILIAGFLTLITCERVWETFFTGNRANQNTQGIDCNLKIATIVYIIMLYGAAVEYFEIRRSFNPLVTATGFMFLLLSFWLRWWSISTLGDQWSTSIRDGPETTQRHWRLIKAGPYAYLRHPIYLAVILEVVAIPAIVNARFTLLFAVLVNVPVQFVRAKLEEQTLRSRFGSAYERYMEEVSRFLPLPQGTRWL